MLSSCPSVMPVMPAMPAIPVPCPCFVFRFACVACEGSQSSPHCDASAWGGLSVPAGAGAQLPGVGAGEVDRPGQGAFSFVAVTV